MNNQFDKSSTCLYLKTAHNKPSGPFTSVASNKLAETIQELKIGSMTSSLQHLQLFNNGQQQFLKSKLQGSSFNKSTASAASPHTSMGAQGHPGNINLSSALASDQLSSLIFLNQDRRMNFEENLKAINDCQEEKRKETRSIIEVGDNRTILLTGSVSMKKIATQSGHR